MCVECLWKTDVGTVMPERSGLKEDVTTRTESGMLRWFDHLERMNQSRPTKQIYRTNVIERSQVRNVAQVVNSAAGWTSPDALSPSPRAAAGFCRSSVESRRNAISSRFRIRALSCKLAGRNY
ncbi:hypothetical protein EVAR_3392_1 [Eumeta japonica]|uniref:Uncharacterized protein n=1 Tax=Eumeta variegata TaxID=151549 RepID=A0A4C1ST14_EUMVA|nr:hypothetical protein EVAR_3392_1 [Eumeta japonica]